MPAKLERDKFFWTIALQTLVVNFFLGGFGPAQPLLRADQGTSLTIAGLHGTAMGLASILAGFINPWISHKFGRANAGWIGMGIFVGGLIPLQFCSQCLSLFSLQVLLGLAYLLLSIPLSPHLTVITKPWHR